MNTALLHRGGQGPSEITPGGGKKMRSVRRKKNGVVTLHGIGHFAGVEDVRLALLSDKGDRFAAMIVRPDAPPLTVEQYRNLPETGPRYQLIDGDLYRAPAPNRYHQDIARNLEFILLRYLASNPIGLLYHAPFDVYLTETDVFQPDIVIIFNENRHILTDAGAEGPPDFVVEILSPKTRALDLENKKRTYARLGVNELWMIDPVPYELFRFAFELDRENPIQRFAAKKNVTTPLLPGLVVELEEVFRQ